MTNSTFIFGDAHSNWRSIMGLLAQEGIVDARWENKIRDNVTVVSIGDLINGVMGSRDEDLRCLRMVGKVIDLLILGNHESPYFGFTAFNGFFMYPEVQEKIRALANRDLVTP